MPSLQWILDQLGQQWAVIQGAPIIAIGYAALVAVLIWLIQRWAYGTLIAHKDGRIAHLEERVRMRDDQLSNKFQTTSPDEARELIATLQAQVKRLTPRRVSKANREAILEKLRVPEDETWGIGISWDAPTPDAERLARDFISLFSVSDWSVADSREFDSDIPAGITLFVPDMDTAEVSAAKAALELSELPFATVIDRTAAHPHLQIGQPDE
jgi:hypothetical protein